MLDTLAHHPDPYPRYDELRRRGVHQLDDGRWVAPTAAAATAVLSSPAALVRESPPPDPVQARMSRFSDGPAHSRRRGIALATLAGHDPAALRTRAQALTSARIAGRDEIDVMAELARRIPVATLAESLNIPHDALGSVDPDDEAAVNVAALLFQTRDATAGLIGNTLLAPARGSVDDLVVRTNRLDPSVQSTTRFLRDPLDIAGTTTPAGAHVVVLLAAANHDPAANGQVFTFGVGCRPCPGATHALALAAGVLDALTAFRPTATATAVRYEPHPNLRIPATLTLRRCG